MRRLLFLTCCAISAFVMADPAGDAAVIRAKIRKGAEAAMRGDAAGIMSHYAKDILLSYPGIADQDYDTLLAGYSEKRPPGMTLRTEPEFEEVLVSADLAVVRVNWTTSLTFTDPPRQTTRQARDIQVWRRERDGEWMFVRGMHFRNATAVPTRGDDLTTIIPKTGRTAKEDTALIREAIRRLRAATEKSAVIRPGLPDEVSEHWPITEIVVSGGLAAVRLGAPDTTRELQIWVHDKAAGWQLSRAMRLPA